MKITKVEIQKNNPNRFSIFIDDEFAFGVTDELKYKYHLSKGLELDQDTINEILELERLNKAVNYTVKLLSYRQRSEKEIRDKLIEKEYMDHQIEYAINYCKDRNYINDYEFASAFTRDKINLNKYGPIKIKYDLLNKGVSEEIVNSVLDENLDNEYNQALEVAKKQVQRYKKDDKYKKYRKLGGYLNRRGFTYDTINSVLNEVL